MYWRFSFDLYYLILGDTNNVLHSLVKKFLCTLWSLALVKKSCSNINNSYVEVPRLFFLVTMVEPLKRLFHHSKNTFIVANNKRRKGKHKQFG